MPKVKELFFFDMYYHKGMSWYLKYFMGASDQHKVICEISHDYLFSHDTLRRIQRNLPDVRLMACLREPVDRAFSSYLYMIKQGRARGDFEDALETHYELIDHGLYAKHLLPYLRAFGRDRIYVALFDDLRQDQQMFADNLADFLKIQRMILPDLLRKEVLPAASPRNWLLAKFARNIGWAMRSAGMPAMVGRIKNHPNVQYLLYRPYGHNDKPELALDTQKKLREIFFSDIAKLDEILDLDLLRRWGYC